MTSLNFGGVAKLAGGFVGAGGALAENSFLFLKKKYLNINEYIMKISWEIR